MSYLVFGLQARPADRKTNVWTVNSTSGRRLGEIRWYSHWRQYAFYPAEQTIFNGDCLADLSSFCWERTAEHRTALEEARRAV